MLGSRQNIESFTVPLRSHPCRRDEINWVDVAAEVTQGFAN